MADYTYTCLLERLNEILIRCCLGREEYPAGAELTALLTDTGIALDRAVCSEGGEREAESFRSLYGRILDLACAL